MSTKTHAAQLKLDKLVDSVSVPPEALPAIRALVTHAYIMGLSDTVVDVHTANEAAAKVARELAAPLGIVIQGPQAPTA